jgi:hypothetical protein
MVKSKEAPEEKRAEILSRSEKETEERTLQKEAQNRSLGGTRRPVAIAETKRPSSTSF